MGPPTIPLPPPSPPVSPPPPPPLATAPADPTVGPSYSGIVLNIGTGFPTASTVIRNQGLPGDPPSLASVRALFVQGDIVFPAPTPLPNGVTPVWYYFLLASWHYTGGCNYENADGVDQQRNLLSPYTAVSNTLYAAGNPTWSVEAMPRLLSYGIPEWRSTKQLQVGTYSMKVRLLVYNYIAPNLAPGAATPIHDQWYTAGSATFTS